MLDTTPSLTGYGSASATGSIVGVSWVRLFVVAFFDSFLPTQ
jgi:hypothetical protein